MFLKSKIALAVLLAAVIMSSKSAGGTPTTEQERFTVVYDNGMGCAILKVRDCTLGSGFPLSEFSRTYLQQWEEKHPDRVFLSVCTNACGQVATANPELPLEILMSYSFRKFFPASEYLPPTSKSPEFTSKGFARRYEYEWKKNTQEPLPEGA